MTKKSEAAIFFTVSGVALTGSMALAYKIHQRQQKRLKNLRDSRNIAWLALKDMLETDNDDLRQRLDIAQRAMLHDDFNQIVRDL